MGVYKLSANSVKNGRTIYGSMLAGNTAYKIPGDFESIATVTVGAGGSSSITFSSIPSTYTHLQLRMSAVGTTDPTIKVNSNFPTSGHRLEGNGAVTNAGADYADYLDYLFAFDATYPSVAILDFLDYTNTNKNKTLRYLYGIDKNGSGEVIFGSKLWGTSAITSITISATINQYSHFALYGIKGVA